MPSDDEDLICWRPTSHGKFTANSCYNQIMDWKVHDRNALWQQLWRIKAPQRMLLFMWRVFHDRLPTNVQRRKWSDCDDKYAIYLGENETILQSLRDCHTAQSLWVQQVHSSKQRHFFSMNFGEWIRVNLHQSMDRENTQFWQINFVNTCWLIWKWRNSRLFEEGFQEPTRPMLAISNLTRSILQRLPLRQEVMEELQTISLTMSNGEDLLWDG
ncbi:hypothetical protein Pint_05062 [Pistacia integerrima]|uniref:Uncharacterized protein n=1 Tax=Pistacia integerrima TaxID=434235 RepID=A0ACC0Z4T3_9ROSI|nr:hypothetical protein Pint_05062 [Pistacia integerrima]